MHREAVVVGLALWPRLWAAGSACDVIHRRRDTQLAVPGAVDEHGSALAGGGELRLEWVLDEGARSGIGLVLAQHRLVGHQLRLEDEVDGRSHRLDLIADRGHRAMNERDQAG